MRLLEGGPGPALGLQPLGMPFGPGALGGGKPPTVPEEEFGEPMSGPEEIHANVLAAAEEITRRFFLLRGNVNRREGAGAVQDGELAGIAPVGLDAITWPRGINAGAITSQGML